MKLRLAHLIQAVFAMIVAVSLSFGASRAFASESGPQALCWTLGYDHYTPECGDNCWNKVGYCTAAGTCRCGEIP